ncbi:hypothetical protein [Halapricum desulfuricans]|uniref:Putative membrane protein n=1 Tax=Halapricum desulfuricans TaxID=2841257 RepID=A0A897N5S3_9EURY|nr:hypothetical protein [Halapricum desulfuricans]QSG06325.1 putative membrane protein [Halapricum desulfuricans]
MGLLQRFLPVIGILYLAYLALQPPPLRWIGLLCLAVLTPFVLGWLLGRLAGIGPWAPE